MTKTPVQGPARQDIREEYTARGRRTRIRLPLLKKDRMMKMIRKGTTAQLQERNFINPDGSELPTLYFPALEQGNAAMNMITTREGGVSREQFTSLNLTLGRGDTRENVLENFTRVAAAFGTDLTHCVCSHQVHETNVIRVDRKDGGAGLLYPVPWESADGLVTNEPGLLLSTFYADCVPLIFVDPVRRAVGVSHSGWRGTAGRIGARTVEKLQMEYGSRPEDLLVGIGPSICGDHYEVSEEVAEVFCREFPGHEGQLMEYRGKPGHCQLYLWEACRLTLEEEGVLPEHIYVTDVCTACNPELLFSHRATNGRRGNFGVFVMLRPGA